ncbi:MAG: hypothetical protein ACQEVA_20835 [Myxococcota bacterium]
MMQSIRKLDQPTSGATCRDLSEGLAQKPKPATRRVGHLDIHQHRERLVLCHERQDAQRGVGQPSAGGLENVHESVDEVT